MGTLVRHADRACEARAGFRASTHGFQPIACMGRRGLRSFPDRQGVDRFYCPARGHRAAVLRMYGVSEWTEPELREAWGR